MGHLGLLTVLVLGGPPPGAATGQLQLFDGETLFGWHAIGLAEVRDHKINLAPSARLESTVRWAGGSLGVTEEIKGVATRRDHVLAPGRIVLAAPANRSATYSSVLFTPASDVIRLFNGKDLTGWKPVPGLKSQFGVNAAGELTVKNGPGDLQTTGQWADFVLQMQVYVNGDKLNSGVFLRARPGEKWSGYESQIRNEWVGTDRTKPIDYGTGAIYRRVPTRRVVSSDRQWFAKTIVADGDRIAVWVDGVQVADFRDFREPADNGRNGLKRSAGVISLQGHDPTTDLRFKDIRLSPLK